ncbi:alkaline phosphatase D family protein [Janthinobacterium sp.]|uniref:alkaline phosphatase D family protein n=1 Tax=Janthinobacterium sp. TaxID=1871054 RepID=UPI00293D1E9A|nr:alkaline phosphatase D family protein [Janthinobacterium sp.]
MKSIFPAQTGQEPAPPPRRQFMRQACSTALLGATALGAAGCGTAGLLGEHEASFQHGVASGDPLLDRVVLWTRLTPRQALESREVAVQWQIAADAGMRQVLGGGSVTTGPEQDYTVKVDAAGLQPGQVYFYRFSSAGVHSPVGRTKTLPKADVRQVRLAVFSCANYPAGYFNVYADAARQDDLDAALHIGDYIYEYESTGYACANAVALGRVSEPRELLLVLADYRRRYAQYRSDPDLQALHASLPFITVWDDHEIADDTWRDGSLDHKSSRHGPFSLRKAAAVRAYHEWLPIRAPEPQRPEKIYRSFDFGRLLSLHMLDTRLIGRDQQLMLSSYYDEDEDFDAEKYRQDLASPRRQMMGREQMAWLEKQVAGSRARWQVLGQQVLMARMEYPAPVLQSEISCADYVALKLRAQSDPAGVSAKELACLAEPTLPCYLDSWDGYQHEREELFALMRRHGKNMVVLAGDTHNAWASDLHDGEGRQVGVEFATSSVSSPGMEGAYPKRTPDQVAQMMQQLIAPLYYAQTSKRGYMIVSASMEEVRCDWRFVDTVHSRHFSAATERSLRTLPGAGNRKIVEC